MLDFVKTLFEIFRQTRSKNLFFKSLDEWGSYCQVFCRNFAGRIIFTDLFSQLRTSFLEKMSTRSSHTGGVSGFSIGGRMVRERERLLGMTDEERRWRAQFLKDQILEPEEPRFSPELYRATTNIFRRTVRFPMQMLQNMLTPILGQRRAMAARFITGRMLTFFGCIYLGTYYMKYNGQDWTSDRGWFYLKINDRRLPGDPDYPNPYVPKTHEYYDLDFTKSHFFKE